MTSPAFIALRPVTLPHHHLKTTPSYHSLSPLRPPHHHPPPHHNPAAKSVIRASTPASPPEAAITLLPSDDEQAAVEKLFPFYVANTAKFHRIIARLQVAARASRPQYPPIDLSEIPPVDPEDLPAFAAAHIDDTYLKWSNPEASKRARKTKELQFKRWEWACDNLATFVNVLRVAGHDDVAIRNMLDGVPMCFNSVELYRQFRVALKQLAADVEKEMEWSNVNFIITGSSVPGFSQNPCKGLPDRPTRITSADSSDVDVCISADGVNDTMLTRMARNEEEPSFCFATTCSSSTSATRYGARELDKLCRAAGVFAREWGERLQGGIQITFAEDDHATPPWESNIDIENV